MKKIYLFLLMLFSSNAFASSSNTNLWLSDTGKGTKTFIKKEGHNQSGISAKVKMNKMLNMGFETKFDCKTGKINISAGIETFINQILEQFSGSSIKQLVQQLKFQTQIELLINVIARMHYGIVKSYEGGFGLNNFLSSTAMYKCVKQHVKDAFKGDFQFGIGMGEEDLIKIDIGLNFIELLGIQSCMTLNVDQKSCESDKDCEWDQWLKSHKWARHLIHKLLFQSLDLRAFLSDLKISQECKDLEKYLKNTNAGFSDNPYWKKHIDRVKNFSKKAEKTYKSMTKAVILTPKMKKKAAQLREGKAYAMSGDKRKTSVKAQVTTTGQEPVNPDTKKSEEKAAETEKAEETKDGQRADKDAGKVETTPKTDAAADAKKEKEKTIATNYKIIKDTVFTMTYQFKKNNDTIDAFTSTPEDMRDINDAFFSNLFKTRVYKNEKHQELFTYLVRKIFSMKIVNQKTANRYAKIVSILKNNFSKDKTSDSYDNISYGNINSYCDAIVGSTKEQDNAFKNYFSSLMKEAKKKYKIQYGFASESEFYEIINKSLKNKIGETAPKINHDELTRESMKLLFRKQEEINYVKDLYKEDIPPFITADKYTTTSYYNGTKSIPLSEGYKTVAETTKKLGIQYKEIKDNTIKFACRIMLKPEYDFAGHASTLLSEPIMNYLPLLKKTPDELEMVKILYQLESPGAMLYFLSIGNFINDTQMFSRPVEGTETNYVLPGQVFFNPKFKPFLGIDQRELSIALKSVKLIKKLYALNIMDMHNAMYNGARAYLMVKNRDNTQSQTHHVNMMYDFELFKLNMEKRKVMLKLLMDKR